MGACSVGASRAVSIDRDRHRDFGAEAVGSFGRALFSRARGIPLAAFSNKIRDHIGIGIETKKRTARGDNDEKLLLTFRL